jgi:protein tyrosine phosphatase (PTP) superfamily phosphohydrolase (DUF442 family)
LKSVRPLNAILSNILLTLIFVCGTAAFGAPDVSSPAPVQSAVPFRFRVVTDRLFRSTEPPNLKAYKFYRQRGITTIIDLRAGESAIAEKAKAESLGFRYENIPLHFNSSPREYLEAERKFFSIIDDPSSGKVVVHCRHGKDRTGLMTALYRVERQGWTADEAIAEWKTLGGYESDWGLDIQFYFRARMKMFKAIPRTCSALFS